MHKKVDEILGDLFLIIAVIFLVTFFAAKVFALETVVKIDEYTAKVTITDTTVQDGTTITLSKEKNFSLDELQQAKTQTEQALKSWQDKVTEMQKNITIQKQQIAMWNRLILQAQAQGIIEKPVAIMPEAIPQ